MDPLAYRKHLLARILRIASTGLAALGSVQCGARAALEIAGSGGGSTSVHGAGGAGGSPSSSTGQGGVGGGGIVFATSAASSTGVTVGVGGSSPDGGPFAGNACLPKDPSSPCPAPGQAFGQLQSALLPCDKLTAILQGPSLVGGACCYEVEIQPFPCYVGRTFFIDEGVVKAELRAGRTWRAGSTPDVSGMPQRTRLALAEAWARDGLFEHASVASFSRFAMQLLALGAPADLVRDTHAAAVDEVRHAELCLGLASAYFGHGVEPAALPFPGPLVITADLAAIAAEVAMEGCIGETVATVQALDALADTTDPAVRAVLEITVEDETRHAELAWRFLAWALDAGGEETREAVVRAFTGFRPPAARAEQLEGVDLAIYAAHGRQEARAGRAIAERAITELVLPGMCALLSRRGGGEARPVEPTAAMSA